MKLKNIIISILFIALLVFSGCSNQNQSVNTNINEDNNNINIQNTNQNQESINKNQEEIIDSGIISDNDTVEIGELI